MKIAIIGAGHMGGSIARGLSKSGIVSNEEICCTATTTRTLDKIRADYPQFFLTTDNVEAVKWADIIMLVVKPWLMEEVVTQIKPYIDRKRHQIVSVAATITIAQLTEWFPDNLFADMPLYRIVPNLAVEVGEGVTVITPSRATEEQQEALLKVFRAMGCTLVLEERLIPAATSLTSCGLAFAMRYIQAAASGSVELGLYPKQARELAIQTVIGAAKLLAANGLHPEEAIDEVTTPGGLTIKGLHAMEQEGFSSAVLEGLKKSMA